MSILKPIKKISPRKLKNIASEATSEGFSKALKSNLSIVYAEGNILVERHPSGKKIRLGSLKCEKKLITNKFKLK
ncbi:MAG: hypothetical protein K0M40_09175 [Prolixibacteraceae bacterium]|nr:hypothetical protein [Prolixibacteraceae bacterium]